MNKFIWIDCKDKFSNVHFIKSKKVEDVTQNHPCLWRRYVDDVLEVMRKGKVASSLTTLINQNRETASTLHTRKRTVVASPS